MINLSEMLIHQHMEFLFEKYDFHVVNEPHHNKIEIALISRHLMIRFLNDRGEMLVDFAHYEIGQEEIEWFDSLVVQTFIEQLNPDLSPRIKRSYRSNDLFDKKHDIKMDITPIEEYASFLKNSIDDLFTIFSDTQYQKTIDAFDRIQYEQAIARFGKLAADAAQTRLHTERKIRMNKKLLKKTESTK